jgi:3-hydroxyisobutyrate dehydrogenase
MAKVTVLGMGAMGSRMAISLLDAGHDVTVWNRDAAKTQPLVAKGAKAGATPRSAVASAEIVISMVRDDAVSKTVWLDTAEGAMKGLADGAVAIESSTISVNWAKELAAEFASNGKAFVEAPVSGSRPQADAHQLIYFVGGSADVVERVRPVLLDIGAAVNHVGDAGSAAVVKLSVNSLLVAQVALLGELIGVMEASGIDVKLALDAVMSTPAASAAAKGAANAMREGKHDPAFPAELVEKDLGYFTAFAHEKGSDVPVASATKDVFAKAVASGLGESNMTAVCKLYAKK